ncbi:MAG: beta-glucosidase [Leptolinea sp.]|nr:beta-glucosidase [Leptolinea sp.]
MEIRFPSDFLWGAATASYQIEGGWNEDGRSPSIWDTFSHVPGNVYQNHTGDIAADHYHRWQEDVSLMKELGLPCYRFSFAWPRIIPGGIGSVNPKGLDFYDRLVDELLSFGIKPFPTLYHWDLPQALEDKGGWPERKTAQYFADYAATLVEHFSDRIENWITINEPWVVSMLGYHEGVFAPGVKNQQAAAAATHHLLLGHGLAVQAMRAVARQPLQIGITLNLSHVEAATDSPTDLEAVHQRDAHLNRIFLDPLYFGKYPTEVIQEQAFVFPEGYEKDFPTITTPTDFLGINNYFRDVVRHSTNDHHFKYEIFQPKGSTYSEMWEMHAESLFNLLMRIKQDYPVKAIYITENGTSVTDGIDADNRVRDSRRIQYLQDYIAATHKAIQHGVPVKGYFLWSLMDNYEWNKGYSRRFGIIFIDYENGQRRIIKDSAHWYSKTIQNNGFQIKTYYAEPF